jgi:Zn-dependent protease/CBS domain-containing protein
MFGKRITIFRLFGFEVRIDLSWLAIAVLVTWTLSQGLFPHYYEGLSKQAYWWMGIAGALGLFVSIIFHEFSHSLVARRYGLPMKGITLFIFGGVAEMSEEPDSAKTEFLMAIAGPVSSIFLGLLFYLLYNFGQGAGWPVPLVGVTGYLAFINWLLAGFNLLPAFPLDGGRVLRSALWSWKHNLGWATRKASQVGSLFGFALIALGIVNVLSGNLLGGIWWFLIGMFLRSAAQSSYQQVLVRKTLEGEKVRKFMVKEPVTVPPSISVSKLVEDYIYKHHFKMFPVMDDGRLAGCITTRQVKEVPRQEWDSRTVGEIAQECSGENTVSPETEALQALALMNRTGNSRIMVVEDGRLAGVLSLKDIMRFISLRLDLDEQGQQG